MTETKTFTTSVIVASNETRANVCEFGSGGSPGEGGDCIWIHGAWPLKDWDELDKFVRTQIAAQLADEQANTQKLSELEASNE